ncbi:tripartite motif-containing protein 16-like [Pholidichthys leucotaenia]
MAQKGVQLDTETFSCAICLDLLKNPVTIPCGHSYCMDCITRHWDGEEEEKPYSCPQCRQTFTPKPALVKNTMLAALAEELKKIGHQAAPDGQCCAGPEDVACDFCTGPKLQAVKSCLVCQASYCEKHLQPHYDVVALTKHKLVESSKNLQENICSCNDEGEKIFCRTDQQIVCYLCSVKKHEGHDTVSAAAERTERQRQLEMSRQNIHQSIQDREADVKRLQQQVEAINQSADQTVEDSEKMFTELIRLIQKRSSDVKQQVRSQQVAEASRVHELQKKLEQEIAELKREDAELEELSRTEDDTQFLHNYPPLPVVSKSTHSSSIDVLPLRYFEDVAAAASELRDKLQELLTEMWTDTSPKVTEVKDLQPEPKPKPKTRADFSEHSREITLDPNTANTWLELSEGNRRVTHMSAPLSYSSYPERFTYFSQVLSRESLSRRCYWEVGWKGDGVYVAAAYKSIKREGEESGFGSNDRSWALDCERHSYTFRHNNVHTQVPGPFSSRIGVHLDSDLGVLSFYSVSETMTLLYRVQTTFTQPLFAGLRVYGHDATAEFISVK